MDSRALTGFLHHAHIFSSVVREVLEEKCLRQATDLSITLSQFNLIRLIAVNANHHIREIASFLGLSKAAASKNVEKLVRLGLVERHVHPDDRRAASLSTTVRGRNLIQKYEALKQEKLDRGLDSVTPEELISLTRGLERIAHLILLKEQDSWDICMKCNAYYLDHCPLRTLSDGCIYTRQRQHSTRYCAPSRPGVPDPMPT